MMAGARQQVRGNCLRANGQYGMNAYQSGNGITGLVVEGNEIVGNNTDDLGEAKNPGCGCTGGIKFWSVDGADIRGNWVHDNSRAGPVGRHQRQSLLPDRGQRHRGQRRRSRRSTRRATTSSCGTTSLAAQRHPPAGKKYAVRRATRSPSRAVYLSESGGYPAVPARTTKIEISGNVFENNWSGITAWENADRFCNSAANTSTGCVHLLAPDVTSARPRHRSGATPRRCRWKTQRSTSTTTLRRTPRTRMKTYTAAGWRSCRTWVPSPTGPRTRVTSCRRRSRTTSRA